MGFTDQLALLLRMALRNIVRRKRRSLIVAATGSVGMLCVVAMMGFINGMFDGMVLVAIDSGLGHAQIRPRGFLDSREMGLRFSDRRAVEKAVVAGLPEGVRYAPRMEREAMLRVGADTRGMILFGIEPEREAGVSSMPQWMVQGIFFGKPRASDRREPPCLVGTKLSRSIEVETDDWVLLSTGGADGATRTFRCRIAGVFKSPSAALDERLVMMRRTDLSRLRNDGLEDEVNYFVFRGRDHLHSPQIKGALSQSVRAAGLSEDVEVVSLYDLEPIIAEIFELYDQTTTLFYFIILLGFGVVLFESVTMSIFERTQEIGITRAVGAKPRFVFWQVIVETFLLTLGGVIGGLVLGSVLVLVLFYVGVDFEGMQFGGDSWAGGLGVIRPFLKARDPFVGLAIAVTVGFLSGIYPALRAVRISPVQAIYGR